MSPILTKALPITELKKTNEISKYCHEANEPIIITKNGYSDLIIMSVETFEREMFKEEVYAKLAEAEAEYQSGAPRLSHTKFLSQLREEINAKVKA
ncbi:prevent-host-death protein [Candidatus Termititenax persephonae]|uniref:Prevent-host-death protein n=1 Tax=Candidatus Termititenax persephonae TaxID=2218525 RepID=A0A388TFB3_9BACT|nr:prevent-host-death protein [Candidatus Termititenax persephonae]